MNKEPEKAGDITACPAPAFVNRTLPWKWHMLQIPVANTQIVKLIATHWYKYRYKYKKYIYIYID